MAVDEQRIARFLNRSELRTKIANVLRGAGFKIVWVNEEAEGKRWSLFLKLPQRLRDLFGTAREVLVWVVESPEFQARTVTQAERIISEERPRLCEDFAIVVTLDSDTMRHVSETAETLDTLFLGFDAETFSACSPYGPSDFIEAMQRRLYVRDLYDLPSAVTRAEDFFGRRGMVSEIATSLRRGGRHVGLFGLRKIGKTSMLYKLRSTLQTNGDSYIGHVDVERIDAIEPSAENLLWSLGESIYDSHRHIRNITTLQLFGKYKLFSSIPDKGAVFELFDHDIREIIEKTRRSIIMMLDEVELLSPSTPGSEWGSSFVRIWRLLRGLDQQFPNRLSYFVTGTNPSAFEVSNIGGRENPVYNYFKVQYLRPLAKDEVENLLVTLGNKMGLKWESAALERLASATGGHPALVRSLASIIHSARPPEGDVKFSVTQADVVSAIDRFLVEKSSLLSQIVAILEEQYKDEYYLLELLARGRIGEFRECVTAFPKDTAHLVGYGICVNPESCTSLEIEILQTFLQKQKEGRAAESSSRHLSPGDRVDGYEVISSIGAPGGFAKVYEARTSADGERVALKVFDNGLLSALQREVEPLQEIDHPNVVRVLDHGKSDDGAVYMVMELLSGKPLRHFCTRSTRASEAECIKWLGDILSAMREFHPNDLLVEQLRRHTEISAHDLMRLEEARHGFIHRDIKPENVIISERGAVLIDFNISVRASEQILTRSATPGYLPPDGLGIAWDVDVDLYQLGVTMLQAALGSEYFEGAADDLRLAAKEELSVNLAKILLRMTNPVRESRYAGATQAWMEVSRQPL
ncbi:serine/threonine-protein kinase [Streptomyces sp. SCSIO ZS0520]|uniref:serine/threonine-protein kinase n=1 Tax=Streptomyces sp. SCSIO ZS0520 TaxID=2892996 RepID=UPI0021DB2B19|nr:serine/threonine-protein kinase [Streptomyces sp. SCSIO ZS0520]